jgi:hypothetical protein
MVSPTGSVSLTSPGAALGQISFIVRQLTAPNVTLQQEGQLEHQLVKAISGANPSANWGTIATIADDLANLPTSAQVNTDTAALDRMVSPSVGLSGVTGALDSIANQIYSTVVAAKATQASTQTTVFTSLTAAAAVGASSITVRSLSGLNPGDHIQIALSDGSVFDTTITSTASTTSTDADDGLTITTNTVNFSGTLPIGALVGNAMSDHGSTQSDDIIDYVPSLTATAGMGASTLSLSSVAGLVVGAQVQLALDNGTAFNTTIKAISTANDTVTIGGGLPSQASVNNVLTDAVNLKAPTGPLPTAEVSSAMVSVLLLQTNELIAAANPTVNMTTLGNLEKAIGSTNTTEVQFQQDLIKLNQLAHNPNATGPSIISVLA